MFGFFRKRRAEPATPEGRIPAHAVAERVLADLEPADAAVVLHTARSLTDTDALHAWLGAQLPHLPPAGAGATLEAQPGGAERARAGAGVLLVLSGDTLQLRAELPWALAEQVCDRLAELSESTRGLTVQRGSSATGAWAWAERA